MSCFVRRSPRPSVAIFSSIQEVSESLTTAASTSNISFNIIKDDALSGYGGPVKFSPESLSPSTLKSLAEAEILISEPAVVASIINHYGENYFRNLKWCQSTYAGVDPLFDSNNHKAKANKPKRNWILTRFAGIFGDPIAEWVLARIIEHERSFVASNINQQNKKYGQGHEMKSHNIVTYHH